MTSPARKTCCILLLSALGIVTPWKMAAGSFNAMTTPLPGSFNPGHMLLLPDGRVMVQNNANVGWKFLNPDSGGHYLDGSWSSCPSMNYQRLFYASDVLPNGQVFIAGGEYNNQGLFGEPAGATAEIFDPQANGGSGGWTLINPPTSLLNPNAASPALASGNQAFWDAQSVVLANGNVLIAPVGPNVWGGTLIYNPSANSWSAGPTTLNASYQDEASWVKLPDNSILTIDPYGTTTERYIPSLNAWVLDRPVPRNLWSTNGEIGAAMWLTNGKALFFGGSSSSISEIYTPSPLGGTNWGTWAPGPNIPAGLVMRDAPACNLINGKLLLTLVGPNSDSPFYIYEYNVDTGGFTQVFSDGSKISDQTSMVQLPDGNVLFNDTFTVYVYTPDPSPLPAGQPSIYSVSYNGDGSLHVSGTLFNGISQGAVYGDDAQQDSNFPLARFSYGGNVYYGRTYNWSSTGVMTGGNVVTTDVALPAQVSGTPGTAYSLQIVANGIASGTWSFSDPVWVDFVNYNSLLQFGTFTFPYSTLPQGASAVPLNGTIAIDASSLPSTGTVTGPYTISTPMTIISVFGASTIR